MSPERLEFGEWFNGRHHDIWHYHQVPEGMRPATLRDLYPGRTVLYQVRLGPDAGDYYTAHYHGNHVEPIRWMVQHGHPVFVKD